MRLTRFIHLLAIIGILMASTAFAGSYHMADTEYGQLEYVIFNGETDGAIILIHGDADEPKWQKLIIDKESRFFQIAEQMNKETGKAVVAIARPGFGKSFGKIKGKMAEFSSTHKHVNGTVEGMKGIIDSNNFTNVTILGFSSGARLGATYALREPAKVKRAVFYDGNYNLVLSQKLKGKSRKIVTHSEKDLDAVTSASGVEYILMYGEKSRMVNPKVTKQFNEKMSEKGFNVTMIGIPGAKHMDFIFNPKVYDAYLAQITK